jgi:hypothetical protein
MRMTHRTPKEALQIFVDLQGRRLLILHWEIFDLTEKHFEEPPARYMSRRNVAASIPMSYGC